MAKLQRDEVAPLSTPAAAPVQRLGRLYGVGALLFGSGFGGLVYQIVWLREMRLVFGASTAASAAVLAIFMGGLGVGGALLGRRADRSPNPLRFYSLLEFGATFFAFISPFLLDVTRGAYISLGGAQVMGLPLATVARLALSALVLGAPTILMGGAMPAATKAVESSSDVGRKRFALLYGCNTLGGVLGALLATFFFLEWFGARDTLLVACCVNALVALLARGASSSLKNNSGLAPLSSSFLAAPPSAASTSAAARTLPPRLFIYLAAAAVGFVFFLMELTWYRMLAPLLGGSTYTFGLILCIALAGIGVGGIARSLQPLGQSATLLGFALTCGLEALCIAFPYALGDRLAILTALLRPLGEMGLLGLALGWTAITALIVFPASVIAGYQFPLLINLLGHGDEEVGKHTGYAYAWNTGGAILGCLAGGFVLLPLLTAPGVWKTVVLCLGILGLATLFLGWRHNPKRQVLASLPIILSLALLTAQGPTAVWRHSPIGAGRINLSSQEKNGIERFVLNTRRSLIWEAEGLESSVALTGGHGLAFVVNGKIDGNVISDAPTQVMLGLVSAILHPNPKSALVIGLGTGCSAGWLAEVDTIQRVDVAELEPAILEVARRCAAMNFNVVDHAKVNIILGDARELLLTTPERYDLIVSEPSNPYRAGIASLYTHEFYKAVAARLTPQGFFTQWTQAYEIDTETMISICAALRSVFEHVEIWQTHQNDMIFICSREKVIYDPQLITQKLHLPHFKSALLKVWDGCDLETFLSHHVANNHFTRELIEKCTIPIAMNTDDNMLVEFGFARSVGRGIKFSLLDVRNLARLMGDTLPEQFDAYLDPQRRNRRELLNYRADSDLVAVSPVEQKQNESRRAAFQAEGQNNLSTMRQRWKLEPWPLFYPSEYATLAWALAAEGDPQTLRLLESLENEWPIESCIIEANYRIKTGDAPAALKLLQNSLMELRHNPWLHVSTIKYGLELALHLALNHPSMQTTIYDLLSQPYILSLLDNQRTLTIINIANKLGCKQLIEQFSALEPFPIWDDKLLSLRMECYKTENHAVFETARNDFIRYISNESLVFNNKLLPIDKKPIKAP